MKITADLNCYLTEAGDVALDKRTYRSFVVVSSPEEAAQWKQITEQDKLAYEAQSAIFGNQNITPDYLGQVDTLIAGISEHINDTPMNIKDSLTYKKFYPKFDDLIGKPANVEFRFQDGDNLYEVLQPHTFSSEWRPGAGTESIYKVVQEEAEGTLDDPIAWKHNMELFAGKYYTDKGVLYKCIRNSGMGLSYDLADLVSGGYVELVNN